MNVSSTSLEECSLLRMEVEKEEGSWQGVALLDTSAAWVYGTEGRLNLGWCPLQIKLFLVLENAYTLWSFNMTELDLGRVLGEQRCFQRRWVCLLTLGGH